MNSMMRLAGEKKNDYFHWSTLKSYAKQEMSTWSVIHCSFPYSAASHSLSDLWLYLFPWLCRVSVAVWASLWLQQAGATLLVQSTGSGHLGPVGVAPRPRTQARQLCPSLAALQRVGSSRIGHSTLSPALAGGFFTTEPPGMPSPSSLCSWEINSSWLSSHIVDIFS